MENVGSDCLNKKSQISNVPSVRLVKKTDGLVGDQHPSVK